MLKQTLNKNNIHIPVGFATSSNDLTNQRLLRHVISRDYITYEFRVILKQFWPQLLTEAYCAVHV